MKRYKFMAASSNTNMIMGLSYLAAIGFPMLAIRLAVFYLGLDEFFKSRPILVILITGCVLYCSYLLIRTIQKSLTKSYVVELEDGNINITEDGEEIMSGKVTFCDINNRIRGSVKAASLDIYTENDKITLRSVAKEYKAVTGVTNHNVFGTGDASDTDALLSLGKEINSILGEYEQDDEA